MTQRRRIRPGVVWGLSRRTTRRYFLFAPDSAGRMKAIFWYCLGYAAQAHGLEVHAATLMSSHHHVVVTDVQGLLPRFLQDFHRLLALGTKAFRGWPEEVFNKESTSCYELVTPEAQLHGMAYAMANPVEAFAVRYAQQWPGAIISPQDPDRRVIRAERPSYFFDPHNPAWPDTVELPVRLPAGLEDSDDPAHARQRIAERTRQYERDAWQRAKAQGISFA